ncbi:hypothetical protein B0H12DRAFT_1328780 [Mycena haematopus]|nr:hypothetical protein B0H12DRAFT_1328780 [Mycena haematopus]
MTPSISVETHSIASLEDCAAWPPEISKIYEASDAPLPSWCRTGPYPFVSDGILPLLSELSRLPGSVYADSCDTSPRLADIFNMVLSTVADIRSLAAHYDPLCYAAPFISTLLRVLMHLCAKGTIIMNETPFVRPRTSTPHRGGFDGVATLIACHSLEGPDADPSADSGADMIVELSRSSPPAVYSMSMVSASTSASSSSSSDASSSIDGIDVPLDAHVIPGCGRHQYVLLPFLCIADANQIVDLMSSVACQRHVWGIPAPAIGFALSNSGTTATLVLSWMDPSTHRIHVVCPAHPNSNLGAAFGLFDFTSPFGALSFAQLVLRLSNEFAVVCDYAITGCENNSLDWRSDVPSEAFHEQSVARWVHEVALASGKSLSLPPTPPPSPPTKLPSHSPDKSDVAMSAGPKTSNSKTRRSSSNFAALSAKGYDKKDDARADILTWTGDRAVFMDALLERSTGDDAEEITEMVRSYNEMCGFLWPSAWNKNAPPPVDEGLTDVLDLLLDQAGEFQKLSAEQAKQGSTKPEQAKQFKMKPEHEKFLKNHMSTLLAASVGACVLYDRRTGVKINEAESRHRWDALIYHFYAEEGEKASPYVLLEKTINYARNQSVDNIDVETFVKDQIQQLRDYRDHCLDATTDARKLDKSAQQTDGTHLDAVIRQSLTASNRAQELLDFVGSFDERPDEYIQWVRRRSYREPKQGICDAILFAVLPGFRDLIEEIEFIIDARTPPQEKPNAPPKSDSVKQLLDNPFHVCTTDPWILRTQAAHEAAQQNIPQFQHDLILPHFIVEYKKTDDKDGAKALNQGRMYLVSMVAFYTALGVEDFPFFALVTSGKAGAILMAWKSSKHAKTYLIERNVRTFDISSPIQAFHFATFLLRLRDDQKKLKDRVASQLPVGDEEGRQALLDRLRRWSKFAQDPEDIQRYEADKLIRAAKAAAAKAAAAEAEAAAAEAAEAE